MPECRDHIALLTDVLDDYTKVARWSLPLRVVTLTLRTDIVLPLERMGNGCHYEFLMSVKLGMPRDDVIPTFFGEIDDPAIRVQNPTEDLLGPHPPDCGTNAFGGRNIQ
jgi:hypothetical protein